MVGMAGLVSGCVGAESPFAREHNALFDEALFDEALLLPDHITPPVKVLPVEGAPEHWHLHERVAAAMREREIPAGTVGESWASYMLEGRFSVPEENDGRIKIAWQLYDNAGNAVGEVMQIAAITNAAWGTHETGELGLVSQAAAESLAPLVPGAVLDDARFAENTGEPSRDDPARRFGPVTALARKASSNGGPLGDRFVGLANVDEVPTLPATAEALGIDPDPGARERASREAARKAALPPPALPPLPEADRVPAPGHESSNSTSVVGSAPDDPNEVLQADAAGAESQVAQSESPHAVTSGAPPTQSARTSPEAASSPMEPASATANGSVTASGGPAPYWVQIGAYRKAAQSRAAWQKLLAAHPEQLADQPHAIQKADLGAQGVFYRVRLGPFDARGRARDACAGLSRAGVDCFIGRGPVSMAANAGAPPEEDDRPAEDAARPEGGVAIESPELVSSGPAMTAPSEPVAEARDEGPDETAPPAKYIETGQTRAEVRGYLGIPGPNE